MENRNTPQVTKRASFGVTRTGYDADKPANLSQWQKETMGELLPLEPVPEYRVGRWEFFVLAIIIITVIVIGVSA